MIVLFKDISELNGYYFTLFAQTRGLTQVADPSYFSYVQKELVKRYRKDLKMFKKTEIKEMRRFLKANKETAFDKVLQELKYKMGVSNNIKVAQNEIDVSKPIPFDAPPDCELDVIQTNIDLQQQLIQEKEEKNELEPL